MSICESDYKTTTCDFSTRDLITKTLLRTSLEFKMELNNKIASINECDIEALTCYEKLILCFKHNNDIDRMKTHKIRNIIRQSYHDVLQNKSKCFSVRQIYPEH